MRDGAASLRRRRKSAYYATNTTRGLRPSDLANLFPQWGRLSIGFVEVVAMESARLKQIAHTFLLVTMALALGICLAEVTLRIAYPKYQNQAAVDVQPNSLALYSRPPNSRKMGRNPDTGHQHPIIYNNLGNRQHRDFTVEDLESAINIGVFGDSFTENMGLRVQHSFTEPLDYLLNLSGKRFNVLNFGVSGYGTDQSYIAYSSFPEAGRLRYVFYVACSNDLRNLYENQLFSINADGALSRNKAMASPWWLRAVAKLHLTYLLMDVRQKLFPRKDGWAEYDAHVLQERYGARQASHRMHDQRADTIESNWKADQDNSDLLQSISVFQAILKEWKEKAESAGARFYIVLLPRPEEDKLKAVISDHFEVVNLYHLFKETVDNYRYDENWHFKKGGHWAEAANQMAAIFLYRTLEKAVKLTKVDDEELQKAMFAYYFSFQDGWMPSRWIRKAPLSEETSKRIRKKYLALELTAGANVKR